MIDRNRRAALVPVIPAASTSPVTTKTPPASPSDSAPENPATPRLPISPPATVFTDPSPRPVSHSISGLLAFIQSYCRGCSPDTTWQRVSVSAGEYQELQNALDKDKRLGAWATDKFRYDYDFAAHEVVIRMPSPLHDILALRVQDVIAGKLNAIKESEEVHTIISRITVASTSDVRFRNAGIMSKKSPDGSFRFLGAKQPPFVIEIANAQKGEDLLPLAESYVEHSKGRIKTVLTMDVEYLAPSKRAAHSSTRAAVYSIYRHRLTRESQTGELQREAHADVENQHFRMHDSTTPPGFMRLYLSDFCPDGTVSTENEKTIDINHEELARILLEAEREEATAEIPSSPSSAGENITFISKRKRSLTPKLVSEDEPGGQSEENSSFSSADMADDEPARAKRIRTRSRSDLGGKLS